MGGLSSVGKILNDVTGATSAGRQSQKYALESAKVNNAYQKEFAQNAHQWEIADLKKAGLNPVLSANGGASANGGGVGSGVQNSAGINPLEPIGTAVGIWGAYEQARNTGADTNRKNAEIKNIHADTLLKHYQTLTEIEKGKLTTAERKKIEADKMSILKLLGPQIDEITANAKFTNERARGFTETTSKTHSWNSGGGGLSFHAEGGKTKSSSHTKTW